MPEALLGGGSGRAEPPGNTHKRNYDCHCRLLSVAIARRGLPSSAPIVWLLARAKSQGLRGLRIGGLQIVACELSLIHI
eukprot:2718608-Alexandrium_andersonii.AAC.1